MAINLEQIEGTIRTYIKSLENASLTESEKREGVEKIKKLKLMREKFLKKNDN